MANELVLYPDADLRKISQPVVEFGDALKHVVSDMTDVMRSIPGIMALGISGIQTRVPLRIGLIEMNYRSKKMGKPFVICNPEILETGIIAIGDEGCLSFPGHYIKSKRSIYVRFKYQDINGTEQYHSLHHVLARCLFHEIDHMNGKLFVDDLVEKPDWLKTP